MKRIALGILVKGNGNETDFRRHKASSIRTVISDRIASHNIQDIEELCDTVCEMDAGEMTMIKT